MSAAYDSFDYPSYWIGREYEHKSELIALKAFLSRIKKIKKILEIGAGFGRLAPSYTFRAKKIILSDPSAKSLKVARNTFKNKSNVSFVHSSIENINSKIRSSSIDVIVMIRVFHHLKNPILAFKTVHKILTPRGYFIFEFANKRHGKATFKEFVRGNYSFFKNEETADLRSTKSIKKGVIPFLNYHPNKIKEMLDENGFELIEVRSVSNIRDNFLKRIFSVDILIYLEKLLQRPLSLFYFGPSIFILARKRG